MPSEKASASAATRVVKQTALPKVAWAEPTPGPSEHAKNVGRKVEQLARRKNALDAQCRDRKLREEKAAIVEAERLRNLTIADSILYD